MTRFRSVSDQYRAAASHYENQLPPEDEDDDPPVTHFVTEAQLPPAARAHFARNRGEPG